MFLLPISSAATLNKSNVQTIYTQKMLFQARLNCLQHMKHSCGNEESKIYIAITIAQFRNRHNSITIKMETTSNLECLVELLNYWYNYTNSWEMNFK